jgi:peptidoglycan hydrolase-like protein with peptidoglycan-binding domain
MTKDQIYQAQMMLNRLGFNSGTPDGVIGPNTNTATLNFQKSYGVTPLDGKLGPITFAALTDAYNVLVSKSNYIVSAPVLKPQPSKPSVIPTTSTLITRKSMVTPRNIIIASGVLVLVGLIFAMKKR